MSSTAWDEPNRFTETASQLTMKRAVSSIGNCRDR